MPGLVAQGLSAVGDIARVAQDISDIVKFAVKQSPEATLAWAGVTLCLPFLTRPGQAEASHKGGLAYIASRMEYFATLESQISTFPESDQKRLKGRILKLYTSILEFQIQSVIRLYR